MIEESKSCGDSCGCLGQVWSKASRKSGVGSTTSFNNAAGRDIRPLALGRKNYLFAGSDGERGW
jgi:Transposase IS66 family